MGRQVKRDREGEGEGETKGMKSRQIDSISCTLLC